MGEFPSSKAEVFSHGVGLEDDFAVGEKGGYVVTQESGCAHAAPNELSFVPPGLGNSTVLLGGE